MGTTSWAQTTVTFDPATNKGTSTKAGKDSVTVDGVTIKNSKGILGNGTEYRFYKSSTATITSTVGNITKIEFTCTASGTAQYGPGCFTDPTAGEYTYEGKVGTWTGSATTVSLTASSNQVRATQIVVTVESSGTSKTAAGLAFSETSATAFVGEAFTAPTLTNPNNLDVTYSSSNEDVATVDANGNVTIVAAGSTNIIASSAETDTYAAGTASYTLKVGTVVNSISEFKAIGTGNIAKWNVTNVQVLYVSNKNDMFVRDATGAIDLYYSNLSYTAGQILNGTLIAAYKEYNNMPEATYIQDANLTATDGTAEPTVVDITALSEANYCDLVKVSGTYNATDKTLGSVTVYDKFGTGALDNLTDGTYTMVAIYAPYGKTKELFPVSAGSVTGITAVEMNAEADGAIYNLAGQRVGKDYKGIVIRNGKKYIKK